MCVCVCACACARAHARVRVPTYVIARRIGEAKEYDLWQMTFSGIH